MVLGHENEVLHFWVECGALKIPRLGDIRLLTPFRSTAKQRC